MGHVATSHADSPADAVDTSPASNARAHRRAETARLLAEAAAATSEQERTALHDEVIRLNMQVAGEIARRYHGRGIAGDDLDQVANLGLVKAVQGFDPTHGSDFLSFAVPTIRGEIRRYFRDFGWTIRPPRSVQELQTKITAAEGELFQSLGRSPRPSEIAAHLGVDLEQVLDSLAANGCFAPVSLDTPLADGESGPVDRLGDLDPAFESAEARVALKKVLTGLTPRERRILEMRFFGGATQAEIGAEVGVTQMQVSRLLSRLLTRLRKRLDEETAPAA
ncbi:SigB/SigF/SigG family RNA polymerase sigma factor [Nocardioides sp. MAHUQ-72]|uniref:SigB/SigF/SigG family RNA polymerase sigma factor n=1 Tax=unclassified Nocardioides TaxID=2615069 RepID=UPI0036218290